MGISEMSDIKKVRGRKIPEKDLIKFRIKWLSEYLLSMNEEIPRLGSPSFPPYLKRLRGKPGRDRDHDEGPESCKEASRELSPDLEDHWDSD